MKAMGKARPRVCGRRAFMPKKYTDWKTEFGECAYIQAGSKHISGRFGISGSIVTKSGKMRSDLDNSIGSILDALQDVGIIGNDRDCVSINMGLVKGEDDQIFFTLEAIK
jgi:Holliday junction resolvase RusA-like endonuclease